MREQEYRVPRAHGPKVAVIGGGHGLSNMLRGLKQYTENISAIVTVADDGGGSGMLREDLKEIEPLFDAFSADVKVSKYGKQITEKLEAIKAVQPGKPAYDFSLTDIDGKTLKLSDFRGKWVLLDFWGSWCIWCRRGNPSLVDLYEKYGGKDFEIIGLAARDKEEAWKKAIEDDHLTWKHANLEMNEGGSELPTKYNVAGYPTKILVDPEGNISVVSVGYHEKDDPIVLKMVEALGETYVK